MVYPKKTRVPVVYPVEPPIDEHETLSQLGYSATTICPSSSEKVVFTCTGCGKSVARARRNVRTPYKCHSCSTTHKDPTAPLGPYDGTATLQKFGYDVTDLRRHSHAYIVAICTCCGRPYDLRISSSRAEQQCRSCFKKAYWASKTSPRTDDGKFLLNSEETQRLFGYSIAELTPKSTKKVAVRCSICGETYVCARRHVRNTSKCRPCIQKNVDHAALQEKRGRALQRKSPSDWEEIHEKRQRTNFRRYPEGIPTPKGYGKMANGLANALEQRLGRKLLREKSLGNGQRLDFFDVDTRIGIEFCGLFWHHEHSPTPRDRRYHLKKAQTANNEGYRVVTVFEDEYTEHACAVRSRLLAILGNVEKVLYARKCNVARVQKEEVQAFLSRYHIQSYPRAWVYASGLYYEGELYALMTGGHHHRQGHLGDLVLSRLCFAPGIHIKGGTERLFKHLCFMSAQDGYSKIVTWSDNRWSGGEVYRRLGMGLDAELGPDYSYVNISAPRTRLSKQSQKKSNTGCPKDTTERLWALEHGLSRIWDCGKRRWSFVL